MPDPIQWSSLQEGIQLIFENVSSLIGTATILHKNEKFLVSASLAVYAFEEMTKVELLLGHYKNKKDLPIDQWKKYTKNKTAHTRKLETFLSQEKITYVNLSGKNVVTSPEEIRRLMANFYHALKTHVFYVNWWGTSGWRWFPREYPKSLQETISASLLNVAVRRFNTLKMRKE